MLFLGEVEQFWQWSTVGKSSVWVTQLIEIWVYKSSKGSWSCLWIVLQKLGNEVNGFSWGSVSEHFLPWKRSDLWESIFFIVRVHGLNLFFRWGSKNLDDLNQLVDTTFTWEDWLAEHELCNDTAY